MSEQLMYQLRLDIAEYFKNPVMVKVNEIKGVGIYKCVVDSMLVASQKKYLVALVKNDNFPIFEKRRLNDINWISFQSRQLGKNDDASELKSLPICELPTSKTKSMFLKESITKVSQNETQIQYVCDTIPINIILLTQDNKNPTYQDKSTIERAIMYFNTVISCHN